MKAGPILLILLILQASLLICPAQNAARAVKTDEFGKANCEEFWARFDGFVNELQNNPDSTGYVLINGEKYSLRTVLGYEKLTNGILKLRNFDRSRLVIIRGAESDAVNIQFWRVPAGAEPPRFVQGNWDLTVKQNKPFVVGSYSEGDGICPASTSVKLFADYLSANPDMRAHIVITGKTSENFAKMAKELQNQLLDEYGVSSNRLKFFFVKNKNYPYQFEGVEFWLVPQKKK